MAKEIERKFLVKDDGWRSEVASSGLVQQVHTGVGDVRQATVELWELTE